MVTIFLQALWESLHRRMGAALLGVSALIPVLMLWWLRFRTQPDGSLIVYVGSNSYGPAAQFVRGSYLSLFAVTSRIWLLLGIFATAPLLTSVFEKGWIDLLLSKGVARWEIILGRYGASLVLFITTLLLLDMSPALYFWARTGVPPTRLLVAVSLATLSFATVLATMALAGVLHSNPAVPIMLAFVQMTLSGALAVRLQMYAMITAKWARWVIDWAYRILPKHHELETLADSYLHKGEITAWWPVWSSAMFMAATLALAGWLFHRKSY